MSNNAEREAFEKWVTTVWRPDDGEELLKKEFPRFAFAAYCIGRAQASGVPEGWQLVPSIPSAAMIKAGDENGDWGYYESSLTCRPPEDGNSVDIYFAMLSAAPKREGES